MSVLERAPAKINLYLHVGETGAHGRHPLESVVAFADCGDIIEARAGRGLSLALKGPFAASLEEEPDNLVLRAARELAVEAGLDAPGAHLTLDKRLPVASGIGGGSADAAATLRALNRLWGLNASLDDLEIVARRIGADVPACIRSEPAFMTGTGEDVRAIALPAFDVVLVNPDSEVPTAGVFQTFDLMGLGAQFERSPAPDWRNARDALIALREARNDLTLPALDLAPEIGDALDALSEDGDALLVRMSGSGATVFAITEDAPAARALANRVRARQPHWWASAARLGAMDVNSLSRPQDT
ncbi:MAG: 4-(cytidine 5'-diphospho)-2-C-methyl-D-erythritol kinase [Hyphomonadaceae bacterium]